MEINKKQRNIAAAIALCLLFTAACLIFHLLKPYDGSLSLPSAAVAAIPFYSLLAVLAAACALTVFIKKMKVDGSVFIFTLYIFLSGILGAALNIFSAPPLYAPVSGALLSFGGILILMAPFATGKDLAANLRIPAAASLTVIAAFILFIQRNHGFLSACIMIAALVIVNPLRLRAPAAPPSPGAASSPPEGTDT